MKNEEKYKTAKERERGFQIFCDKHDCFTCPCEKKEPASSGCRFIWLSLEREEEEPKQDLPFKVTLDQYGQPVIMVDDAHPIYSHYLYPTPEALVDLCDQLNAAALAWHERMKKEGKQ